MTNMSSTPSTLSFTTALITGAGGGLGLAMAKHLISLDKHVILAGRTESKLKAAALALSEHDQRSDAVSYYVVDTGDTSSLSGFVSRLLAEHPEVDCLINNAGVQRPLDINVAKEEKEGFDMQKASQEIDINIKGPMFLTALLLDHFKGKARDGRGAVIMNVGSVLGFLPMSTINPVYNGTKAWMHFWTVNLREQVEAFNQNLRAGQGADQNTIRQGGIKVVELVPPTVETDLHRERRDPDDNKRAKGNEMALSLDDWIRQVGEAWEGNMETIGAGMSKRVVISWEKWFRSEIDNWK